MTCGHHIKQPWRDLTGLAEDADSDSRFPALFSVSATFLMNLVRHLHYLE